MTPFEEYFTAIIDGRIVACEKMKLISELLLTRYAKPEKYHFDEREAVAEILDEIKAKKR